MADLAIVVEGLGKRYRIGRRPRYRALRDTLGAAAAALGRRLAGREATGAPDDAMWALRDVSFRVRRGDVVGVIGANGAGKSTLLKVLAGITRPTEGRVTIAGRVGSLLEVGTGFHPELTGRENIHLSGAIVGMRRHEITAKFDAIVAFAEIEPFLDTPVKHYSTGMYLRLGFAVAAHLEPEVLLVDEVLAVGDAQFQRKCLGKMNEVARGGRTVLLVSHNMAAIQNLCTDALLIARGRLAFQGPPADAAQRYLSVGADAAAGQAGLTEHPGRPASMEPVLTGLALRGLSPGTSRASITTGDDVVFELAYDTQGRRLDYAALAIFTASGERVCTVGTHLSAGFTGVMHGKGLIECRLPAVPLADGEYSVLAAVGTVMPPSTVDEVQDALRFRVESGDYFGTGRRLLRGQGALAQRSSWRIVE